jgi:hypothetical protein
MQHDFIYQKIHYLSTIKGGLFIFLNLQEITQIALIRPQKMNVSSNKYG